MPGADCSDEISSAHRRSALAQAAAPPPDTRCIWRRLSSQGDRVEIGKPINISNSPGYDNQPSFTPDGASLLFTSVRAERKPDPANGAAIGSDIYRYDLAGEAISQVTEYAGIGILADGDSRRASHFRHQGGERWDAALVAVHTGRPRADGLVPGDIKPVGYHAWADASVAGTVRSRRAGAAGDAYRWPTRTGRPIVGGATGIGRSIQRIPGGGISFVSRPPAKAGETVDADRHRARPRDPARLARSSRCRPARRTPTLRGRRMGCCSRPSRDRFRWRRGDKEMTPAVDPASWGSRELRAWPSSPKGDRIALVAQAITVVARVPFAVYALQSKCRARRCEMGLRESTPTPSRRQRESSTEVPRKKTASCTLPVQ